MGTLEIGMYLRERHRLIHRILDALDAKTLADTRCLFAGGTAIVLQLGEYRESVDIDFLVADPDGYRALRNITTERSLGALLSTPVPLLRDVRADRYGIRTVLSIDGHAVKFEIVSEGRIALEQDASYPNGNIPVPVLRHEDLFAEKLLANTDRWNAPEAFHRDAIDLAFMMQGWGEIPEAAFAKAHAAYGPSIDTALSRVAESLSKDRHRVACMIALGIDLTLEPVVDRFAQTFRPRPSSADAERAHVDR